MANTSSRTLRLLSLLQAQRHWPGAELADRLGTSVRILRRDIDRLRELGYPVEGARGVDGGYQLAAGASLPPLALDDEEAVAVAVGLQAATTSTEAAMAEPSLRALAKIVQVMPARLRRQVDALRAMTITASWAPVDAGPDPSVLLTAAQACRASEGLAMDYTAVDGAQTQRRVEPHRLVSFGRRWYLVAYDLDRQAWRNFRLDRVATMAADGRRFRPRKLPAADAAAFVRQSITTARINYDVRAVLDCPAATARERLGPWAEVADLPGDRCRLIIRTESLPWAAMALGSVAAEISDVEPPELAAVLRDWAARFAAATDDQDPAQASKPRAASTGRTPSANQ
ncbi:MAG: putative transcriptional regulator [Jatrophihabitantaceae bacterium]|nr:putative transcriptional regulator [Jatrophihabitantaceae bacterium]